jgi:nitrate reductase delta subunit
MNITAHQRTSRVLAAMLSYPGSELRAAAGELAVSLREEAALPAARITELETLLRQLGSIDPYEVEARYVETFDRGRSTSLHLFEHVHGDSRERGSALVDLLQTYERAGLHLAPGELPDHLAVVLEFASTQPSALAREFLGETAHILNAIFSALRARESVYASVIAAVLELVGQGMQAVPVPEDPKLDEAWVEPPAFDGCSSRGRARPDAAQPIHFVRKAHSVSPGASSAGSPTQTSSLPPEAASSLFEAAPRRLA